MNGDQSDGQHFYHVLFRVLINSAAVALQILGKGKGEEYQLGTHKLSPAYQVKHLVCLIFSRIVLTISFYQYIRIFNPL